MENPVFIQQLCPVGVESSAIGQSCVSPTTRSGGYRDFSTLKILCSSNNYVWWVWRVLQLDNPVFRRLLGLVGIEISPL